VLARSWLIPPPGSGDPAGDATIAFRESDRRDLPGADERNGDDAMSRTGDGGLSQVAKSTRPRRLGAGDWVVAIAMTRHAPPPRSKRWPDSGHGYDRWSWPARSPRGQRDRRPVPNASRTRGQPAALAEERRRLGLRQTSRPGRLEAEIGVSGASCRFG
jgi:hypothetical protein